MVGYVGMEVSDLILYMAKVLSKIGMKVLIINVSDDTGMDYALKLPEDLDSRQEIIYDRGVYYTRKLCMKDTLELFQDGVILINLGWNVDEVSSFSVDTMYYIANGYSSVYQRIISVLKCGTERSFSTKILLRGMASEEDFDYVREEFIKKISEIYPQENAMDKLNIKSYPIEYLYFDFKDYIQAVCSQRYQEINLRKASKQMRKYVLRQVEELLPGIKKNRVQKMLCGKGGNLVKKRREGIHVRSGLLVSAARAGTDE